MGLPAKANFPASTWDGGSADRSVALDNEPINQVNRRPSANDYAQVVAEVIAMQTSLLATMKTSASANTANLAQTATTGFSYMPIVNTGKPSGTPANTPTGFVPFCYDVTGHKISVFDVSWLQTGALT